MASQATYIVVVAPNPLGCLLAWSAANGAAARGPVVHVSGEVQGIHLDAVGETRVWVDKSSFLPLKTEVRDTSGTLLERSAVTSVQYNVSIAPSTFSYTPLPGVTVSTFSGGDGADVKRELSSGSRTSTTKTP